MQKFKYQKFHDLKPYHVHILRDNSTTIAFNRFHRNDYLVAAKSQDMFELKSKLFPRKNQNYQSNDRREFETSYNTYRSPPNSLLQQEITERYIST